MIAIEQVKALLDQQGLVVRGCLNFAADTIQIPGGRVAKSAMLIGCIGAALWPHFGRWLDGVEMRSDNPLDDWSKNVIRPIAETIGGYAVFPSDKPFYPFQQWAMQAEGLKSSLLLCVQ
jgi:hypothetical protein